MISKEYQQKYQHYHQEKLSNMNILQGEEILPSNQRQFAYSPLEKASEKQTKTVEEQENIKNKGA